MSSKLARTSYLFFQKQPIAYIYVDNVLTCDYIAWINIQKYSQGHYGDSKFDGTTKLTISLVRDVMQAMDRRLLSDVLEKEEKELVSIVKCLYKHAPFKGNTLFVKFSEFLIVFELNREEKS